MLYPSFNSNISHLTVCRMVRITRCKMTAYQKPLLTMVESVPEVNNQNQVDNSASLLAQSKYTNFEKTEISLKHIDL